MDKLNKINNELKVYINESTFISNRCRNKLLKIFCDEFSIDLDIDNYQNVDLSFRDDFKVVYREDVYESKDKIKDIDDLLERYERFKDKADKLLKKKEIDFQNKSNVNNVTNLIIVICILLVMIALIILVIHSFLIGDYFDCIWFVVFIIPWIIPKLNDSLTNRMLQAKNYLKSLFRKIK